MKIKNIFLLALVVLFASCEKDNYDAPQSFLKGRIVYNGEPINVESTKVDFSLYQLGYAGARPIPVLVAQDGSFSSLLYNGDYKMTFANQGPFKAKLNESGTDTVLIKVNGTQTADIEVVPFYMVRNTAISAAGESVNATFSLEKIITNENAKNIERVNLYVNRTQFVSGSSDQHLERGEIKGSDIADMASISISSKLPKLSQGYVFARVGVKIEGIEDMIFSPVQKINLQ